MKRRSAGHAAMILGLAAVAALVGGFILVHQTARFRLPWEARPFRLQAEFSTAQAITPGQGQSVRVAGVQIGLIKGVHLEDGRAIVDLDLEPRYAHYIHDDARALLRPRTALKDMFIDLDPGTRSSPFLARGGRIGIAQTNPDINADETYDSLDADGRDYLRALVNGLGRGLDARGGDLRQVFKLFEPLNRDVERVSRAFANQHAALGRLVHDYRLIVGSLAGHDADLDRFVTESERVFSATAPQRRSISAALTEMPGAFDSTTEALGELGRFARAAQPALTALRPAARRLDAAEKATLPFVRDATPLLRDEVRPFVRSARPYVRTLVPAATRLAEASPSLRDAFAELNRLFNMAAYNPKGREPVTAANRDEGYLYWLAWTAQTGNSVFSMADGDGLFRRTILETTCDGFRQLADEKPELEPLIGFGGLLSDPTLCSK
jgi:phospholipid/cholesterol/gamma-HCH transport system substrate-binding protein